jgi:hypothetical protein
LQPAFQTAAHRSFQVSSILEPLWIFRLDAYVTFVVPGGRRKKVLLSDIVFMAFMGLPPAGV